MSEDQCKAKATPNDRFGSFHKYQCTRKPWKDGFCKQHHPDSVKARRDAAAKKFDERMAKDPRTLLANALKRIVELEAEIAALKVTP